jgi:hypothetical protein
MMQILSNGSTRKWLAPVTILALLLLGGLVVLFLAPSEGSESVTEENYDKIVWQSMTRSEIDKILGAPALIHNDENISGVIQIRMRDSIWFVSVNFRYAEVRTYIGKPNRQHNRLVIRVGFLKDESKSVVACQEWSPTAFGRILNLGKEKLGL